MKLLDFISRKAIVPSLKARDRKGVVQELVTVLKKANPSEKISVADIAEAVLERETKIGSTGIGGGVALPHARVEGLKNVVAAFGRAAKPIDFAALDREPVGLFFLIVSPPSRAEDYTKALAKLAKLVKAPNFCKFLRAAKTAKDLEEVFRDAEEMVGV